MMEDPSHGIAFIANRTATTQKCPMKCLRMHPRKEESDDQKKLRLPFMARATTIAYRGPMQLQSWRDLNARRSKNVIHGWRYIIVLINSWFN